MKKRKRMRFEIITFLICIIGFNVYAQVLPHTFIISSDGYGLGERSFIALIASIFGFAIFAGVMELYNEMVEVDS